MLFRDWGLRALAAVAFLAACQGEPRVSDPAAAGTPPLIWRDVAAVRVLCHVTGESAGLDRLRGRLCERARELASDGAPVPVTIIEPGDPAVLAPDSVTLLVHASVQPAEGGDLVAFAVRPFRNSADQAGLLFGAAPRAVLLPSMGEPDGRLDEALAGALAETLPWLARPAGPRRIN